MLKSNTYITAAEAAKWAKLNGKIYGFLGGVKASRTIGDLKFEAKDIGTPGNDLAIELTGGATAGNEVVTVTGNSVVIQIEDGVSTAAQIKLKADASSAFLAKMNVTVTGAASNPQAIAAVQFLQLGAYSADYKAEEVEVLESIINSVTSMVESILGCPVLARDYVDILDGSNSNTLIPQQYPIISITELKIDYNRNFDATTALDAVNYFLRGQTDKRQIPSISLRVVGQDIVLRDDNEKYILGRIFAGSSLGSIRLSYKAGWGLDSADIPDDIRLATLLAIEFFFMQRDNRDLNIQSKGVKGESYTKVEKGLPQQVLDLLEPFKDLSLGSHAMPQRNTFKI